MSTQPYMWPFSLFAPGNLTQPILPGWSFGNVSVTYAGNPDIEKDVVEKVASYGKQLGIITDAVLALADATSGSITRPDPKDDEAIKRLKAIAERIEKVKAEHKSSLVTQARDAMERLAKAEPASARRIAAGYAGE